VFNEKQTQILYIVSIYCNAYNFMFEKGAISLEWFGVSDKSIMQTKIELIRDVVEKINVS